MRTKIPRRLRVRYPCSLILSRSNTQCWKAPRGVKMLRHEALRYTHGEYIRCSTRLNPQVSIFEGCLLPPPRSEARCHVHPISPPYSSAAVYGTRISCGIRILIWDSRFFVFRELTAGFPSLFRQAFLFWDFSRCPSERRHAPPPSRDAVLPHLGHDGWESHPAP